jgi:hypothetical protein
MNAAERIRSGKRAHYAALEQAGINTHTVDCFLLLAQIGNKPYVGQSGQRRWLKLTLSPAPMVSLARQISNTPQGFSNMSDATLKGAFPESLNGSEILRDASEQLISSTPSLKNYDSPTAFRQDLEAADYFLIDGEPYHYQGDGFLNINPTESEWELHLVRAEKSDFPSD